MKRIIAFIFQNFGPLTIFYAANHFYGLKIAILLSLIYTIAEIIYCRVVKKSLTTFFKFSVAMTFIFGGLDLYLENAFFYKIEASISNLFTAIFFGMTLFQQKPLIQQFAEQQGRVSQDESADKTFFFRLFTVVWTIYFILKAGLYLFINLNTDFEQGLLIRMLIGNISFGIMLFISIGLSRPIWRLLVKLKLMPSSKTPQKSLNYFVKEVKESDKPSILDFSQTHPWKPAYPRPLAHRFINELVSSNGLIFDFHDDSGRVACAVLIDQVKNPANDACIEVLGLKEDMDPLQIIQKIIELSKEHAPKRRTGFQLSVIENSSVSNEFIKSLGLKNHYSTYEMENSKITSLSIGSPNKIQLADKSDVDKVYRVLCEAFKNNPDTSIPEFEIYKSKFLTNPKAHFFLWKEDEKILGFANLIESENGKDCEVRIIGVLPSSRRSGIGKDLLQHCLNETLVLGFKKCNLTVAVENAKALGLYLKSGFTVVEKYNCYRMDFK